MAIAAEPRRELWDRFAPGSLMARIFLINLLGLVILALGILYFNQFRQSLIDARAQSLRTQAQIIAAAIAGSATADTGSIVIDPNSLDEGPEAPLPKATSPMGWIFPSTLKPPSPCCGGSLANTGNRAQIIDPGRQSGGGQPLHLWRRHH